ncbi:hypothetical protein H310_05917 [Aphanomyces invadans]|uniref:Inner centromere protein ARK-binding domain-containing protein n=1 Tax=Aphanomyces invadans TaxID=157072 RepID=A0A024U7N0_9STRA|nr:hypothetical protein H310_05917 [Aphanomyces invadans]ETW02401.1 hypothetical protein H310_05917 [Aphanomyces invadans]|eukprot:XP_008869006.1 hypothetical protein H310_05917 [Aphanomyces invadans]
MVVPPPSSSVTTYSEKSVAKHPSPSVHSEGAVAHVATPSLAHAAPPVKPPMAKQNTPSKKELTNYEMSDGPESDDSGNSDSECKKIPSWAQRDALEQALARQFGPSAIDPTPTIFPDFVDTCDLEAIFQPADASKKKRFQKRTSSGNWLADRPTMRDKVAYKRAMGFK